MFEINLKRLPEGDSSALMEIKFLCYNLRSFLLLIRSSPNTVACPHGLSSTNLFCLIFHVNLRASLTFPTLTFFLVHPSLCWSTRLEKGTAEILRFQLKEPPLHWPVIILHIFSTQPSSSFNIQSAIEYVIHSFFPGWLCRILPTPS